MKEESELIKNTLTKIDQTLAEYHKSLTTKIEGRLSMLPDMQAHRELKGGINKVAQLLDTERREAATEAEHLEYARKVEALAAGLPMIAGNIVNSIRAVQSGDPYATSAAVLDLCGSACSTIGGLLGPAGAAAGALVGAVLSVVSMILRQFLPEPPPITKQIENIMRKLQAEEKKQDLSAGQDNLMIWLDVAATTDEQDWTFEKCFLVLSPDSNTIFTMRVADSWLKEPNNQHLPLWKEVLDLRLINLTILKIAESLWLPVIKAEDKKKVLTVFNAGHNVDMKFLEEIDRPARDRGTVWHIGSDATVYVSDYPAVSGYTKFSETSNCRVMAVSNQNAEAVAEPYLSIFTVEPDEGEFKPSGDDLSSHLEKHIASPRKDINPWYYKALHPFRRNGSAWMLYGQWPLASGRNWRELPLLKGCYDIWAIPGDSRGEVSVFTATGKDISRYKSVNGQELKADGNFDTPNQGYKVGAVRVAYRPTLPREPDPQGNRYIPLEDRWAIYGLCEVGVNASVFPDRRSSDHFEIQACFSDGKHGCVLPPWADEWYRDGVNQPWANVRGIAVDSVRLWVFRSGEIACATHSTVKQRAISGASVSWSIYKMPYNVGNYDPSKRLFHGLQDLSPCDDGTLTALFNESSDGPPRIITCTTRFESDNYGHEKLIIDDWVMDKSTEGRQSIKQPIFCWPMLQQLRNNLQQGQAIHAVAAAAGNLSSGFSEPFDLGRIIEEQRSAGRFE